MASLLRRSIQMVVLPCYCARRSLQRPHADCMELGGLPNHHERLIPPGATGTP